MYFAMSSKTLSPRETNFSQDIERWKELISYKLCEKMDGWRREKGTQFSPFHSWREKPEMTSSWISHENIRVDWECTCTVVRLGLSHWHRTRGCRQVSLGKPSHLASRRTTWAGWNVMVRDRKPGPASEVERHWKMVKLCRIPRGCCWACRRYSQCYHYSGYTHLTQKYLFSESILAVSLWQSAGSLLLYSWFKLKLLRIMGQLSISSHPPPKVFMREHNFHDSIIVWTSGYCINLSWGK